VLPVGEVITSLSTFAVLYSVLLVLALYFGSRIIARGPDLTLEPPNGRGAVSVPVPNPSA
jgi:cytochrome d ubiquinol oxidase subunit I